ncbi:hypothetical protein SLEP1_g36469 [Rubroshorea leprosula]|uniref:Uncharacterized protein n=1 Tax=Rubroshorea leprosula TaxID=152421 RepID=A0AAV5KRX0_9ROSI|nr:hypothetical protein SLEP1_g36469 [Rubroshorea leprosula]
MMSHKAGTEAKLQNCNRAIGIPLPHPCSIFVSPSASPPPNRSSKHLISLLHFRRHLTHQFSTGFISFAELNISNKYPNLPSSPPAVQHLSSVGSILTKLTASRLCHSSSTPLPTQTEAAKHNKSSLILLTSPPDFAHIAT